MGIESDEVENHCLESRQTVGLTQGGCLGKDRSSCSLNSKAVRKAKQKAIMKS